MRLCETYCANHPSAGKRESLWTFGRSVCPHLSSEKTHHRLLSKGPDGSVVPGLSQENVEGMEQVTQLMAKGNSNRAVGVHDMNAHSSRSHSILCIRVAGENLHDSTVYIDHS